MSRLLTFSGDEFASGESPCFVRPGFAGDRLSRLLIHVEVWGARTAAVLDTGGAFLMLDPMFAAIVGIDHADALARDRIRRGTIHRLPFAGRVEHVTWREFGHNGGHSSPDGQSRGLAQGA